MKHSLLALTLVFMLFSVRIAAQEDVVIKEKEFKTEVKDGYKKAIKNIEDGNANYELKSPQAYKLALECYLDAYKYNQKNPELNYKIGVCYLNSQEKTKAYSFLKDAYDRKPLVATDVKWQLGRAMHYKSMFAEAFKLFTDYKKSLPAPELSKMRKAIDKQIEECNNGLNNINNFGYVKIEDIASINSSYPDYSPLITADESMMVFTSRRQNTTGGKKDEGDNEYFEDIYISYNKDGKWTAPQNIGSPLNTPDHDATVGLSADGQQQFLFFNRDIYVSRLEGDKWSKPVPLPPTINNSLEIETSACFSPDGNTIYFVRGKSLEASKNNRDIYMSHKDKAGKWGVAQKLPTQINTPYDEEGVFMHPDGKTLYFSSKGHNTIGGYDVFMSVLQNNNTWSAAVNLGPPINTPDDDVFFVMSADGRHGYISAIRENTVGSYDIYKINFVDEELLAQEEERRKKKLADTTKTTVVENKVISQIDKKLTLVKGTIIDAKTNLPIEAEIEIVDNEKNEVVTTTRSNKKTGNYLVTLPSGKNYGMAIKSDGYLFYSENFDLAEDADFKEVAMNIPMVNISQDATIVLNNVFFDFDKSILKSQSYPELARIIKLMKDYKNMKVEISGHTDSKGDFNYNQKLSEGRAKAVVDYLVSLGVAADRMQSKGYSFSKPIATNDTDDGRARNRRVEFKILSK